MRLQLLSDLHLETETYDPQPAPEAELLVVLEDSTRARRVVALPLTESMLRRTEEVDLSDPSLREHGNVSDVMSATYASADVTPGRFLFTKTYQDSGEIDVALREPDGSTRRLTTTPRDDGNPTFMPDGRLVLIRPMENSQRIVVAHGWLGAVRAEWAKGAR